MASGRLISNTNNNLKTILHLNLRNNFPITKWQQHQVAVFIIRNFINSNTLGSRKKEYSARKLVGYSMEQMFTVVSDVEKYKEFLPFCNRSDILVRREDFLKANLTIGFPPIKERYVSNVTMRRPYIVQAICTEGKLLDSLETAWKFMPGLKSNEQSCIIDFAVSFQFRSLLYSQVSQLFFDQLVKQMEKAFISEAARRYGKASTKVIQLSSMVETS